MSQGKLEWELRLRVSRDRFEFLQTLMQDICIDEDIIPERRAITVYYDDGRTVTTYGSDNRIVEVKHENKIPQESVSLSQYIPNLKYVVSIENPLLRPPQGKMKMERERFRSSYFMAYEEEVDGLRHDDQPRSGEVRFDFTRVPKEDYWQVEIELPSSQVYESMTILSSLISLLQYNSVEMYTHVDAVHGLQLLGEHFAAANGRPMRNEYTVPSPNDWVQANDLHTADLRMNWMLSANHHYWVTPKIDGRRGMLVGSNRGTFLYQRPIDRTRKIGLETSKNILLDVEVVDTTIYILDVFSLEGKSYSDENFITRRTALDTIHLPQLSEPYVYGEKPFLPAYTANLFYEQCSKVLDWSAPEGVDVDGLIFVKSGSYNNHTNVAKPKQAPDVFKWKPQSKLSIDLLYAGGQWYCQSDRGRIPFTGSMLVPFVPPSVLPDRDGVYELLWDAQRKETIILRFREDKVSPNADYTAQSGWDLSHDPILEVDLRGKSLRMAFKHQNRIKHNMYNQPLNQYHNIIIDVGSGRGGDLEKMFKIYRHLYLIEPDKENIKVLQERARGRKYNIFDGGIQDAKKMKLPNNADVVSFMFTMSFCIQYPQSIIDLIQRVSPEYILIYTPNSTIPEGETKYHEATFNRKGNVVEMNITDESKIVKNYVENVVDVDQMLQLFPLYNIQDFDHIRGIYAVESFFDPISRAYLGLYDFMVLRRRTYTVRNVDNVLRHKHWNVKGICNYYPRYQPWEVEHWDIRSPFNPYRQILYLTAGYLLAHDLIGRYTPSGLEDRYVGGLESKAIQCIKSTMRKVGLDTKLKIFDLRRDEDGMMMNIDPRSIGVSDDRLLIFIIVDLELEIQNILYIVPRVYLVL